MGKALYRKYRSKKLAEIVGQEHITRALDNALQKGAISHAYLFTGPRGVGKTSIARILAHEVNNLPYDETTTHLDIIEIDAASNRRIDEVRDLRDKVHLAPTSSKYKVYIIDEVHMLTREAFNALLKTLEEPPAHVIFILATTEVHKLPETIVSRTQHYAFRPIEEAKVVAHLADIAKMEHIAIDEEALTLIARHGEGSFRDSISILDQVRSYGDAIALSDVEAVLGVAPEDGISELARSTFAGDASELVSVLTALKVQGIEATIIAKQLAAHVRSALLRGELQPALALPLLENLLTVSTSSYPSATLELVLLRTAFSTSPVVQPPHIVETPVVPPTAQSPSTPKPVVAQKQKKQPAKSETVVAEEKPKPDLVETPTDETAIEPEAIQVPAVNGEPFDASRWPEVLDQIKRTHNTLYGVLRMAEPSVDGNELTLSFNFAFHQKRVNDPKNKQVILQAVEQVSGSHVSVTCVVSESPASTKPVVAAQPDPSLAAISNIFGSAEVLES